MSTESGFHLAGGELTVTGPAEQLIADGRQVDFGVTAELFGGVDGDVVMLAGWSSTQTDAAQTGSAQADAAGGVRSEDGRTVLSLRTQPVVLNSLPRSVRVRLSTTPEIADTESAWELVLRFRNQAGSGLTWRAGLPAEAFGAGWSAPLADLLTIDDTATETAAGKEEVRVVHHADDEYYELLVDGEQAGLLIYHVIGSHLAITHTVIEPTYRGRGLSWVLVGRALDDIRTRSVKVSNYCTVVRRFVELNPEYGDLLGAA
ncbi:GNAT family N-acetyltransferase [Kribbella sp. NPDC048928]|uniref:GNAT family N-acetyltransferase n=1 Tax=Kribbella sp. NPDC048928 TaxID=3364111 RepID=UPI003721471E